jgi:hypothetical protein
MYAEADNEISDGPTATAIAALNEIRMRAFGSAAHNLLPGTKSDFFNAIVNERSLELGGEGIRKYDLIRWNLLGQKISETKNNLTLMSTFSAPYNNLPSAMFLINNTTADDKNIWLNSYYYPTPASTPEGVVRTIWLSSLSITNILDRFASGYTAHKSELLPFAQDLFSTNPQLVQNPNY